MHILASWFRASFGHSIPILSDIPDYNIETAFEAAAKDLENDIPILFGDETIDERQQLELTGFAESLTYNVNQSPLISINTFEFKYNNHVLTSDVLMDNITFTNNGQIAILPEGLTMFYNWYNTLLYIKDQIPLGLSINYQSGMNLDYTMISYTPDAVSPATILDPVPTSEQFSVINAIARRTLIDNLMLWITNPSISSKSISMDGVSQSNSGGVAGFVQYIDLLRQQEKKWADALRRKYGFDMLFEVL